MERFEHGGDVAAHPGVLDFSASLNPLGIPASAREALVAQVDACASYPDPACRALTEALAGFEGVNSGMVLPCAGATDAIWRLCQALRPRRVLVCDPCYSGYEQAAEQAGAQVVHHALRAERGFAPGEDLACALDGSAELAFLANPNNPTGLRLPRELLVSCLERARSRGVVVALDECFVDLTDGPGSNDLLERYPNLVIVKALTKTFALAGLRVGHALCADRELLARMRALGQPWAVSVPAQVAGVACLADAAYLARGKQLVGQERMRLRAALACLGLEVVPGEANYLLFRAADDLTAPLLARGVMVRSCANFAGLDERWHRVAVRLPHENDVLIEALGEVVS